MTFKEIVEIAASVIVGLGGGGAIVFGLSSYLGKIWADRSLEKVRQEHTKLNLELTHNLDLVTEQAKHFHQMDALEHQIRFSKLHERRAEVIEELYKRLVKAKALVDQFGFEGRPFLFAAGDKADKAQAANAETITAIRDLYFFIEEHRIYLPERVCALLEKFVTGVKNFVNGIRGSESNEDPTPQAFEWKIKASESALKAFETDIPMAKRALAAC